MCQTCAYLNALRYSGQSSIIPCSTCLYALRLAQGTYSDDVALYRYEIALLNAYLARIQIQLYYAEIQFAKQPNFEVLTLAERFKLYNSRLLDICYQQYDTISVLQRRCAGVSAATDSLNEQMAKRLGSEIADLKNEASETQRMLQNAREHKTWSTSIYEGEFLSSRHSGVGNSADGTPPAANDGLTRLSLARCRATQLKQSGPTVDSQAKVKFVLNVKRK